MSNILEKLSDLGVDIEDGMYRFMENKDLYIRCLQKFPAQAEKCTLHNDLAAKDYEAAVQSAHAMKGVTGNLSITPLYMRYTEMVNRLRAGETEGLEQMEEEISSIQTKICAVIKGE